MFQNVAYRPTAYQTGIFSLHTMDDFSPWRAKTTFFLLCPVHIEEFTNVRVYKSQFWRKPELFHSFWVAMDLIRCPGVLDKIFGPLGVHRVPNLGSKREQIAAMNFDYFDTHTCQFLFNLNTDNVKKELQLHLHSHHTHILHNFAHPHFQNTL